MADAVLSGLYKTACHAVIHKSLCSNLDRRLDLFRLLPTKVGSCAICLISSRLMAPIAHQPSLVLYLGFFFVLFCFSALFLSSYTQQPPSLYIDISCLFPQDAFDFFISGDDCKLWFSSTFVFLQISSCHLGAFSGVLRLWLHLSVLSYQPRFRFGNAFHGILTQRFS